MGRRMESIRAVLLVGVLAAAGLAASTSTDAVDEAGGPPAPPPSGSKPPAPPAESYAACKGKNVGATCSVTGKDGSSMAGTCAGAPGKAASTDSLSCRPARGGGPPK